MNCSDTWILVAAILVAGCTVAMDAEQDAAIDLDAARMDGGPSDGGPVLADGAPPIDTGPSSARHTARPLGSTAASQGYWEYVPPGYPDGRAHPLLLFLHGIGENGNGTTELVRVLSNGPPKLIDQDEWPGDRPFIVLSTQWSGSGCHTSAQIHAFLTYAIAEYDVDPLRVYLTGLSCGAIGAWDYFGEHIDEQIAAIVPIAGDGDGAWSRSGCALGRVPIWAFHGDADDTVTEDNTIRPMTSLLACDPAPREALMTIYPGVGHDSWTPTYDGTAGHDIYSWMLRFSRP